MSDLSNIRIDGARLWDSLMDMAKIGPTPKGGSRRLTLTDLDRAARHLFADSCGAAGLTMTVELATGLRSGAAGAVDPVDPVVGAH